MSEKRDPYLWLTREESQTVLRAFLKARGIEDETKHSKKLVDDAYKVVKWAEEVRVNEALLELILAGQGYADVKDGEVVYGMFPKADTK